MRIGERASIACALLLAAAVLVPAATADSTRVTQGDAEAIFQATGGKGATLLHSPTLEGAPDQDPLGRIGPFGAANGRHFCSLDWHLINANIGTYGPYNVAAPELNGLEVTITLDGSDLQLSTTAVKRADPQASLLNFGSSDVYFRDFGSILSPDALAVGTHTVSIVLFDPSNGEVDTGGATFYVDAPGTGACV
jgi:hypothetical protein